MDRTGPDQPASRRPRAEEGDEVIVDGLPHGEFCRQLFLGENLDSIPVAEASKPRKVSLQERSEAARAGAVDAAKAQ
jgi:HSP20 family protein